MKWITRSQPKPDRIACLRLINALPTRTSKIIYVAANRVLAETDRAGDYSFDAPGADYAH